ncbi:hypothetical protein KAR91_52765 [Candidatus Pacearchaeota archaeon]|nr:hypothetical protein [Candidatus Pacearchaeota archaeon]
MALTGVDRFQAKLVRVGKATEAVKLWGRIGFQAIDIISQRSLKGKDYQGAAFHLYDKKYARRKKAKGGGFFSGVNLHASGNMFAAMKAKSTARNTTLFFSKPLENKKAFIHHKGIGVMPKREFFDLSPMEEKELMGLMAAEIRKAAK